MNKDVKLEPLIDTVEKEIKNLFDWAVKKENVAGQNTLIPLEKYLRKLKSETFSIDKTDHEIIESLVGEVLFRTRKERISSMVATGLMYILVSLHLHNGGRITMGIIASLGFCGFVLFVHVLTCRFPKSGRPMDFLSALGGIGGAVIVTAVFENEIMIILGQKGVTFTELMFFYLATGLFGGFLLTYLIRMEAVTAILVGIIGGCLLSGIGTYFTAVEMSENTDLVIKLIGGFFMGSTLGAGFAYTRREKIDRLDEFNTKYRDRIEAVSGVSLQPPRPG